jgi:clan AA aspartic protease
MTDAMGKIVEKIQLANAFDEDRSLTGDLAADKVRRTEIEALVDTGATMLMLPADVVARLGLRESGPKRKVRYADGRVGEVPWVGGVRVRLCGREGIFDALVESPGTTALIGQIPLEELDLHVDPKSRCLRVNPASPDAPLLDLLGAA